MLETFFHPFLIHLAFADTLANFDYELADDLLDNLEVSSDRAGLPADFLFEDFQNNLRRVC